MESLNSQNIQYIVIDEEDESKISKNKEICVKPMSCEEAVLQMELSRT